LGKDNASPCSVQAEGEVDNIDEICTQEKGPELATEVTRSTCALLLKHDLPQGNLTVLLGETLKILHVWEKKLDAEVTTQKRLRFLYECFDKNEAESSEIYEVKAEVKLQLSKVNEIINVFKEMWRLLAKYHHKQFQTRSKSCGHMVEKELRKLTQKVEEHIRTFRESLKESLKGYIDRHGSFVSVLNEWLNKNTMEEDDQTETEAPEIFRVCCKRLKETENVDGVKVLSTIKLFMAFTIAYYRGSVGALLVYNNMTSHSRFENATRWQRELRGHTDPNSVVILISNKCELRGMVEIKTEETKAFDKRESPYFMEMSVLDSTNVENAFSEGLTQIHKIVSKRRVDEPNKEGERGSGMELRFRSLGFKQVKEERQRMRTEKLCKELETKMNKNDEVIFKASLNLEYIEALNSSEADDNCKNGKDDMGSCRASRTTNTNGSIDDTNQGESSSVKYKSDHDHNNNLSLGAGGGDIAPTSIHYMSVSVDNCFMDKLFFGEESLNPPPSPHGTVSRKDDVAFSIEFKNAAKIKKIMAYDKLSEMAMTDPKRAKRILVNRQSTARSKERKIQYIVELEHKVQTLQTEATTLSAQFTLLQRDMMGLTNQNNEFKFFLQAMEQQAQLSDALNKALGGEVQRLKQAIGEIRHKEYDRSKIQLINAEMVQQLNISQLTQQPQSQQNHESLHKYLTLENMEPASQAREIEELKHKLMERDEERVSMQSSSHLGDRELHHMSVEISIKWEKVSVVVSGTGNKSQFLSQTNEIVKRQEDEIHSLQRALKEKEEHFQMSIAEKRLEHIQYLVQRENLERQRHMFRFKREGQLRDSVCTALYVDNDGILRVRFPGASRGLKADPSELECVDELKVDDWVRYDWFSVGKESIAAKFRGSHSVSENMVSVSVLSCEVTNGDTTSLSSLYSRAGFGIKDAISFAGDLKFLLNVSKAVGKFDIEEVSKISRIHGKFRDVIRSVYSDDEEHGKLKRKRRKWYLQKKEIVVLCSCEADKVAGTEAVRQVLSHLIREYVEYDFILSKSLGKHLTFREMRRLTGAHEVCKDEFKLKGENVGISLK
ncbi:unnamed protein product, partial [Brassica napus]